MGASHLFVSQVVTLLAERLKVVRVIGQCPHPDLAYFVLDWYFVVYLLREFGLAFCLAPLAERVLRKVLQAKPYPSA